MIKYEQYEEISKVKSKIIEGWVKYRCRGVAFNPLPKIPSGLMYECKHILNFIKTKSNVLNLFCRRRYWNGGRDDADVLDVVADEVDAEALQRHRTVKTGLANCRI